MIYPMIRSKLSEQLQQQQIGQEVKDYYKLQADGSFTTDVVTLIAGELD